MTTVQPALTGADEGIDECGTGKVLCSTNPGQNIEPCWDETCPKCGKDACKDLKRPSSDALESTPTKKLRNMEPRRILPVRIGDADGKNEFVKNSVASILSPTSGDSSASSHSLSASSTSDTSSKPLPPTTSGSTSWTTGTTDERDRWYNDATMWCHKLALEGAPDNVKKPRYSAILELTLPLNASKSKRIVMGIDLERGLLPFVSIENAQSKGVVLTLREFELLFGFEWKISVNAHMKNPSYQVRNTYTEFHEYRCSMADSKPVVQISPLKGKGGYVYLGEATWNALNSMSRLIFGYVEDLRARMESIPCQMSVLLSYFLKKCDDLELDTLDGKINRIADIFDCWVLFCDDSYKFVTFHSLTHSQILPIFLTAGFSFAMTRTNLSPLARPKANNRTIMSCERFGRSCTFTHKDWPVWCTTFSLTEA
ncbi:uncharacterized protein LOC113215659 [Frankliniella occidentalis]|uniref:Uncharacterized protein LOC113215659 n=1 Tax=Frankliniella occidentalis TaxID=133901 RepID=A0A9C6X5E9_FRAOC|nr:uncharacterized protein LOC113215659 [Frankliniella occidentalis]